VLLNGVSAVGSCQLRFPRCSEEHRGPGQLLLTGSAESASKLKPPPAELVIGVANRVAQVPQLVKDEARKPNKAAHPHWISHALHLPRVDRAQLPQSRKVVGLSVGGLVDCVRAVEDLRLDCDQMSDQIGLLRGIRAL